MAVYNSAFTGAEIDLILAKNKDITKSISDPTANTNPDANGALHINYTSGEIFVCTDPTPNANVWKGQYAEGTDLTTSAWLNRGSLYQSKAVEWRLIELGVLPNATNKSVLIPNYNDTTYGYFLDTSHCFAVTSANDYMPLPFYSYSLALDNSTLSVGLYIRKSSASVYVQTWYDRTTWTGYATVCRYVK